ncbi:MAG: hypothetical protein ABSF95_22555, partial [Verrucomicrobiota bacterium]
FDWVVDWGTVLSGGARGVIYNAGLFRKSGGTGVTPIADTFINTGTVEARSGTLNFNQSYAQSAGLTLLDGGSLASPQPIQILGGTLAGNGVVAASVINSGVVRIGTSPGILSISGDYTQTDQGALRLQLAGTAPGTGFDQLAVSGAATLGGALDVALTNGFQANNNDTFLVLANASRNGVFASFPSVALGNGRYLNPVYLTNGVQLVVAGPNPTLTALLDQATGTPRFQLLGVAGLVFFIEATTNFTDWTSILTNKVPGSTVLDFVDLQSTNYPHRFYRAELAP